MRTLSRFIIGAALTVALPVSAMAQRPGAIEIGGFGRVTRFADTLRLDTGLGIGGRAGLYIYRNWLLEMELSYADVDVTPPFATVPAQAALDAVSHTLWAYRLTYNHPVSDRVKMLAGAGYAYDAYGRARTVAPRGGGPQGLLGMRVVLNDRLSARVEGTGTYITPADNDTKPVPRAAAWNVGAQAGLSVSFFTRPPAPPRVVRDTMRIVTRDTVFVTRLDTVRLVGPSPRPVVIGAINFAFNAIDISPEAKTVLDAIAASLVDPSNAARTITVTGNTDAIGSERFNETLGQGRADQAKAYLVSKGVAESRILARSQGEKDPVAPNTTDNGRASNRRVLVMLTN
ncbi:MAG: OmpA family protein [Gemmatimonadota bacterium]|nr:OmpA family protein [Gemmatimonadota bacterium]